MAQIPEYQRRATLLDQIGVVRSGGPGGSPGDAGEAAFAAVARGTSRIAAQLDEFAQPIMSADSAERGRAAGMQRDAGGNLTFVPVDNTTEANRAYNRAGLVSYESSLEVHQRARATELRRQAQDDPTRFAELWRGQAEGVLSQVPQEMRPRVEALLTRVGSEHQNAMVDDQRRRDFSLAVAGNAAQLQAIENDLAGLASAGQLDSPRGRQLTGQHNQVLQAAVGARILSPEQAQARRDQLADQVTALATGRQAVRIMRDVDALSGDPFQRALAAHESGGQASRMERSGQGFAGLYQFGAPALQTLGMYQPGPNERVQRWNAPDNEANRWTGSFSIPGHPEVRTLADFLANPAAQNAAFVAQRNLIDREIDNAGLLQRYGGQVIAGTPITRDSLRAMAWLGGPTAMRRFVESGGQQNPADSNGVTLSEMGRRFAQVGQGQADATLGERYAREWIRREVVDNPNLRLSPEQRAHIGNLSEGAVRDQAVRIQVDADAFARDLRATQDTIHRGQEVPTAQVEQLERRAQASGDQRQVDAVRELRVDRDVLGSFARLSPSQQSEQIGEAQRTLDALPESATPIERDRATRRLDAMRAVYNEGQTQLQRDGFAFGARAYRDLVGPVAAIDWANPDPAVMERRRQQADAISARAGRTVLPVTDEEVARLKSITEVANATTLADLLPRVLRGFGPQQGPRVLAELARRSDDGALVSAAAAIGADDQGTARAILAGREAMRANAHFAPENNEATRRAIDQRLGDALALRPDARASVVAAARAIYANEAQLAGDTTGRLDEPRLQRAIDRVTGGMASWNGGRLIVPRRGMGEADFAQLMEGLTNTDVGPAQAADGSQVTADMIRRVGRLRSIGEGRYGVTIGGFEVLTPDNRAYVLDLRSVPVRERPPPELRPAGAQRPDARGTLPDAAAPPLTRAELDAEMARVSVQDRIRLMGMSAADRDAELQRLRRQREQGMR